MCNIQSLCSRLRQAVRGAFSRLAGLFDRCFFRKKKDDDDEILKFWIPQRSFSIQSGHSLGSAYESKRESLTSASTIVEEGSEGRVRHHSNHHRSSRGWPDIAALRKACLMQEEGFEKTLVCRQDSENSTTSTTSTTCTTTGTTIKEGMKGESSPREDRDLIFGLITFTTCYDDKKKRLGIYLDHASDLPPKGRGKFYDTIVKLSIVAERPPGSSKRSSFSASTEIVQCSRKSKNTLHPQFHDDIHFAVEKLKLLKNKTLRLTLFDSERQGRHDAVGHALLPLACLEKSNETLRHSLPLKLISLPGFSYDRQLLVSLCYQPSSDRLSVGVLRCKELQLRERINLKNTIMGKKFETYAKVALMCAGEKIKSVRTKLVTVSCEADPIFNQTFSFVLPYAFVDDTTVVISVCVKGGLKNDSVIGRVLSGPFGYVANGKVTQWGRMLADPKPVTEWRYLYQ